MNTIRGKCFVKAEGEEKMKWEMEFVAVPRVGEGVLSPEGEIWTVVSVTHAIMPVPAGYVGAPEPGIIIHLKEE